MRADEFLVERYIELEKKVADLEEVIEDKEELLEEKREEIFEFKQLFEIIAKYIKPTEGGVHIFLSNILDKDDFEYLSNYFDVEFKEENG